MILQRSSFFLHFGASVTQCQAWRDPTKPTIVRSKLRRIWSAWALVVVFIVNVVVNLVLIEVGTRSKLLHILN